MKNTGVCAAALCVLQILWLAAAHAAAPAASPIEEEIAKQEMIYQSRGEQVPAGYTIGRSLTSYTEALHSEFDRALAMLGPKDRWLDIGAGEGRAVLDYYTPRYDMLHFEGRERRGRKAQAVAISIEDRRTPQWQDKAASLVPGQIQYLAGKRLREYGPEELGRFQVVTDVLGGFSYTTNLSLFMERVLGILALNGNFFSVLSDVHAEDGKNAPFYAGSPFLTEIVNADASELKVCSWLKKITCVEVACEFRPNWRPPMEAYRVRKICNDVTVPALTPKHFEAGTPPERRFQAGN